MIKPLETIARGALFVGAFALASGCAEEKPFPRVSKKLAMLADYEKYTIVNNKDAIALAYQKCYGEPNSQVNKLYEILKADFVDSNFREIYPNRSKEAHGAKTYLESIGADFDMMMGTMALKERTRRPDEEYLKALEDGKHDTQIDKRIKMLYRDMQESMKKIETLNELIKHLNEGGGDWKDIETFFDENGSPNEEIITTYLETFREEKEKEERESRDNFRKIIRDIMLQ